MAIHTTGTDVGASDPRGATAAVAIQEWIEADPFRPGDENARVRKYGVPVWALVGHAEATARPAGEVAEDYDLPVEAVEAALAYYAAHRALIDGRIAANRQ